MKNRGRGKNSTVIKIGAHPVFIYHFLIIFIFSKIYLDKMRALIYELNDILVHQCTFLYIGICHIFILKNLNPQETGAHPIKMVYFDIFSVYLYVIYV